MTMPSVALLSDGGIRFADLSLWFTTALLELDEVLDPDQPERVKRRLYPLPSDDAEEAAEWERLVHPDLFALVASARAIVLEDLNGLETSLRTSPVPPSAEDGDEGIRANAAVGWGMTIPGEHVQAWISALQTARLTLAELHEVGESESSEDIDPLDARSMAIAKMRTYAWLLELVLECVDPELRRS